MKNLTHYPSKNQILNWLNSYAENDLGKLRKIQELGNCSAFLYMIAKTKPGIIKLEKVFKNPVAGHQITHNIKMLMNVLEKMNLNFNFEIDRLASLKYQQSFHLATFMYQNFRINENTQESNNPKQSNIFKKRESMETQKQVKKIYKVTVPVKPKPMILAMDSKDDESFQNINEILKGSVTSQKKYEDIQEIFQEGSTSDQQKLSKIAKILNMNYVKGQSHAERLKKALSITPSEKLSIQASYKSYIRPSLSRNSKFLNDLPDKFQQNKMSVRITQHEEKDENGMERMTIEKQNNPQQGNYQNKYEEDLLYSNKNSAKMEPKEEKIFEMPFNQNNHDQNNYISEESAYPAI